MNENDELEKENDDFESSQVTDGENFSADEEQDKGENFTADEEQDEKAPDEVDMSNSLTVSEYGEQPNDEQQHEGYDDFGFYEKFFKDFADEHGLTYTRNEENHDFEIFLKADENTTRIQIDHGRNLTMTAKDNNNETVVPDQQMFDAIAELAHQQGNSITFGNIETPEYAARLYLACKTHQPPIEMIGKPEMNDAFLEKLDPETKAKLDELATQETESKQDQTYDEAPTDNQEEDPVAEYDNNSNSVDNNATEHTEQNTPSTSESEGVQVGNEVEVVPSQREEASKPTNDFASDESSQEEILQYLQRTRNRLPQNKDQKPKQEQNNPDNEKAQAQVPTITNILRNNQNVR